MFFRKALTSILHLFIVCAFFFATFLFISLPYLPHIQEKLLRNSTSIGLSLFIASFVLLIGFYLLHRGKYLVVKMGVRVDINIMRQTVEECFSKEFAQKIVLKEIELSKKSLLEMRVSLLEVEKKSRKEFLLQVEKQLGLLLRERVGYTKPFYMTLSV